MNLNYPMEYLTELLQAFEPDSRSPKMRYNEFIVFVYKNFEDRMPSTNSDKYIKMRNTVLSYIVANEKSITSNLSKK